MDERLLHFNRSQPFPKNSGMLQRGDGSFSESLGTLAGYLKRSNDMYQQFKDGVKNASDMYSGYNATMLKNMASHFDPNPLARSSFIGEKHIPILTDTGVSMANFCGPGTNLDERLERGDIGVDGPGGIDEQCKKHDIAYLNAKTEKDILDADKKLLSDLDSARGNDLTKSVIKTAIKGKMLAEDFYVMDRSEWIGNKEEQSGSGLKKLTSTPKVTGEELNKNKPPSTSKISKNIEVQTKDVVEMNNIALSNPLVGNTKPKRKPKPKLPGNKLKLSVFRNLKKSEK